MFSPVFTLFVKSVSVCCAVLVISWTSHRIQIKLLNLWSFLVMYGVIFKNHIFKNQAFHKASCLVLVWTLLLIVDNVHIIEQHTLHNTCDNIKHFEVIMPKWERGCIKTVWIEFCDNLTPNSRDLGSSFSSVLVSTTSWEQYLPVLSVFSSFLSVRCVILRWVIYAKFAAKPELEAWIARPCFDISQQWFSCWHLISWFHMRSCHVQ